MLAACCLFVSTTAASQRTLHPWQQARALGRWIMCLRAACCETMVNLLVIAMLLPSAQEIIHTGHKSQEEFKSGVEAEQITPRSNILLGLRNSGITNCCHGGRMRGSRGRTERRWCFNGINRRETKTVGKLESVTRSSAPCDLGYGHFTFQHSVSPSVGQKQSHSSGRF